MLPILIVKNEEENIRQTLMPFILENLKDFFILDTGSTDNTVNTIKSIYQEFNLNGIILEEEFIDFSSSRNRCIELAKDYFKSDYILFLDAEWYIHNLKGLLEFCEKQLTTSKEFFYIKILTNKIKNYNIRLFKTSANAKFENIVHENIIAPKHLKDFVPENIYFYWNPTKKGRDKSKERWKLDIKKLNEKKEKTRTDIFNLARTYFLLEEYTLAKYTLKDRISLKKIHGEEEVYYSYYLLAKISKDIPEKIEYYLNAFNQLPTRGEPLFQISLLIEDLNTKYTFLKKAISLKEPKSLFVNFNIYNHLYNLIIDTCYQLKKYDECNYYYQKGLELKIKTMNLIDKDKFLNISEKKENENNEIITIAILSKNKEIFLPTFLKCLEAQTWPKEKTNLYIRSNNNTDCTIKILKEWVLLNKDKYNEIFEDYSDLSEKVEEFQEHEWNKIRFKVLGKIRNDSIKWSLEKNSHYFVLDCDNFIFPETISEMYKSNCPIVAPFMKCDSKNKEYSNYSNFHACINNNGYYKRCLLYYFIFNRVIQGLIDVPVVHCGYFIRKEYLHLINYDDLSERYEYVIFSDICRKEGIKQYLDNRKIYGYISFARNREGLENEEWFEKINCM